VLWTLWFGDGNQKHDTREYSIVSMDFTVERSLEFKEVSLAAYYLSNSCEPTLGREAQCIPVKSTLYRAGKIVELCATTTTLKLVSFRTSPMQA
jgi:hypothetical protein